MYIYMYMYNIAGICHWACWIFKMGASMKGNWMEWPGRKGYGPRYCMCRVSKKIWHDLEQSVDEHGFDSRVCSCCCFCFWIERMKRMIGQRLHARSASTCPRYRGVTINHKRDQTKQLNIICRAVLQRNVLKCTLWNQEIHGNPLLPEMP